MNNIQKLARHRFSQLLQSTTIYTFVTYQQSSWPKEKKRNKIDDEFMRQTQKILF